jgi:hypothetical protein
MDSPNRQLAAEGLLVGAVLLAPGSCAWALILLLTGSFLWDGPIPFAGLVMCLGQLSALAPLTISLVASWRFTVRRTDFWALIFYGLCFAAFIPMGPAHYDLLLALACATVAIATVSSLARLVARFMRSADAKDVRRLWLSSPSTLPNSEASPLLVMAVILSMTLTMWAYLIHMFMLTRFIDDKHSALVWATCSSSACPVLLAATWTRLAPAWRVTAIVVAALDSVPLLMSVERLLRS